MAERIQAQTWLTLARHQIGALAATVLDFAAMIAAVERFGLTPVWATAIGATLGGVTNFLIGRAWVFPRNRGAWAGQALRYGLASSGSAGWNALGEYVVHDLAHVHYVSARLIVAIAVSLLWNFPIQRRFVFRESRVVFAPPRSESAGW